MTRVTLYRRSFSWLLAGVVACQGSSQAGVDSANSSTDESRVVVLPFVTIGDSGGRYFGVGLATEVERSLVEDHHLVIVPSPARLPGPTGLSRNDSSLAALGDSVRASHVLTGTIKREGPRTEIVVRLVRTRDSLALWSGTYWRETAKLHVLPAELTADVVDALRRAPPLKGAVRRLESQGPR